MAKTIHDQQISCILRLMRAILLKAADDVAGSRNDCGSRSRWSDIQAQRRGEALAWLDDTDADHLFSFLSICDILQLDPAHTQKQIIEGGRPNREKKAAAGSGRAGRVEQSSIPDALS